MPDNSNAKSTLRRISAGDPAICTIIGEKTADSIRLRGRPGCGLFGPYVNLHAGPCIARVILEGQGEGYVTVELTADVATVVLASRRVDLATIADHTVELRAMLLRPHSACEVRLHCEAGISADISAVEIEHTDFEPYVFRNCQMGSYTFDMWITDPTAQLWYAGHNHNLVDKRWCLDHIRQGMTVADCGAHHGQMTVVFSKAVGATGKVLAWEAFPSNAEVIEKNLQLNGCANATVRAFALGDELKRLPLHVDDNNTRVAWADPPAETTRWVEVRKLDDDISPHLRIDFLKIDVEGSDLQMMRGARRTLAQRPIIDLEVHNFLFTDRQATLTEMFAILEPLSYQYFILPENSDTVLAVGEAVDLRELIQYQVPHVFCMPCI
jgi:FkbM family methyltransferase